MNQLKISINGQYLELEEAAAYISFSVSDFLSDYDILSNKTNSINIPATPVNNQILGRMQELNTTGFSTLTARVESSGFEFTGKLVVYPSECNSGKWYYPIQVVGGNGDWAKEFDGELLKDTDMDYCNHALTALNIRNSELGTKDYVYDLADRGKEQYEGKFMLIDRYPALRIRAIIESMFREKGIKVISNYLNSSYFNRKFLFFTQTNDILNVDGYKQEQIYNTGLFSSSYSQSVASGQQSIAPFSGYNFISSAVYQIEADNTVNHRYLTQLRVRFYRPNSNVIFVQGGGFPPGTANINVAIYNNTTLLGSYDFVYTEAMWNSYVTITTQTPFTLMVAGTNTTVRITTTGYFKNLTASPITINFEVDQTTGNYLRNFVSPWFTEGSTVTMDKVLPQEITKLDFLKWITRKYDLLFNFNSEERKLYIEDRANFYDTEALTWSNVIDLGSDITIEHTIQPENDIVEIRYKEDSNDKSQYAIRKNEIYRTTVGNAFTQKGVEVMELPDSDTIFARQIRFGLTNTYIPTLWAERVKKSDTWFVDGSLVYPEQQTTFNYRILDYLGRASCEPYTFEGTTYTQYPKFERETLSELVSGQWVYKLKLLKYAKRLVCNVLLTDSQINLIRACSIGNDLRTPIIVTLPNIADSIFTIEKIEDYNLSRHEPTRVYLVEAFINVTELSGTPEYDLLINGDKLIINDDGDTLTLKGEYPQDEYTGGT